MDCRGGYVSWYIDITDALSPAEDHEVIVRVYDPTEFGDSALIGKQRMDVRPVWCTFHQMY